MDKRPDREQLDWFDWLMILLSSAALTAALYKLTQ